MGTEGKSVIRPSGLKGILASGKAAVFDDSETCGDCCGSGDTYIGGTFTSIDGTQILRFAKYDGVLDAFSQPANGIGLLGNLLTQVYAIIPYNGKIIVGGTFTEDGLGNPLSNLVEYDPVADTITNFAVTGADNTVLGLATDGTDLYACGNFTMIGGVAATNMAKWNGVTWSTIGVPNATVDDIAIDSLGQLWACGVFTTIDGTPMNQVGVNTGAGWAALPNNNFSGIGYELEVLTDPTGHINGGNEFVSIATNSAWLGPIGGKNYNAGVIGLVDIVTKQHFSSFHNATPEPALQPFAGVPLAVLQGWEARAVEMHGGVIYIGGLWLGAPSPGTNNGFGLNDSQGIAFGDVAAASTDGSGDWSRLSTNQPNGIVNDIHSDVASNHIFVGGAFGAIGTIANTRGIAKYNPGSGVWTSMGGGLDDGFVNNIAFG